MLPERKRDWLAIIGLGLGAVFGLAGTFVSQAPVRQVFWLIDGVGLVVASALLVLKFLRRGCDGIAAGFLVFGIGESFLIAGTAAGLEPGIPLFGAGVALWAAGLFLILFPPVFALWVRVAGAVAAVLFVIVAVRIFRGEGLLAISRPLPFFAYPFLVATFGGWICWVVRNPSDDLKA